MSQLHSAVAGWSVDSWRTRPAKHIPNYPDIDSLRDAENTLTRVSPLVTASEVMHLRDRLALVAQGKAFLLQGGDCAESFAEFSTNNVRESLRVLLQMALVLSYSLSMPVVKVARMAGQFAKPRSKPTETQGEITLPTYCGDIINAIEFATEARKPDPNRMVQAYHQSAQTMNMIRAYMSGGFGAMTHVHDWNLSYVRQHTAARYNNLCEKITHALDFMSACGIAPDCEQLHQTNIFTSHEALLLYYEQALTRQDDFNKHYVDGSAHMLWIGDRTKAIGEAHVEFLRGVINPIGIKIGPSTDVDELLDVIDTLNPKNTAGKIVLIVRMGQDKIANLFPSIAQKIRVSGKQVIWSSDPMHGNIRTTESGYKTREFESIVQELSQFFAICQQENIYGGGIHLEMTGQDVTECIGGGFNHVAEDALSMRYHTHCDPRLNATQAIEIAFVLADSMKKGA